MAKKARSEKGAAEANVVLDMGIPAKALAVSYDKNNVPAVRFIGHWTGKDIPILLRLIPKEYKLYKRAARRAGESTKEEA